ncbi:hypothetical protein SBA3_3920006 [Candidatus Sulfopaludibacter sp. SbA3]|nr:hypothetical protein SBA3_3920006 [Candidatus Sulfopaludibacter sp. SbA3]
MTLTDHYCRTLDRPHLLHFSTLTKLSTVHGGVTQRFGPDIRRQTRISGEKHFLGFVFRHVITLC